MKFRECSVIIPTYQRVKDIGNLLSSLEHQTVKPSEIITVDDTPDATVKTLVAERQIHGQIPLTYVRGVNNLSAARNMGASLAQSDIVLFLDSDTILASRYIEKILEVYATYPMARGVQGFIASILAPRYSFWHCMGRLYFWQGFLEKEKCKLYVPIVFSYPHPSLDRIIQCEYMTSSNASFTKETIREFKWDENIRKPAGEDIDYSYRIYKKYPRSLYLTPHARLLHLSSPEGRRPDTSTEQYAYLFHKLMPQTAINKLLFHMNRTAIRMVKGAKQIATVNKDYRL
jgi:glycosyltransferase involved in cell wall biosynthesis